MEPALFALYVERLGLRPSILASRPEARASSTPWRISAVDRGLCTVLGLDAEGTQLEQRVSFGSEPLAVGDWVLLDEDLAEGPKVGHVLERTSHLKRGSAHREGQAQLIAANLDTVFVVGAFAETVKLERRALQARRFERFIAAVCQGGALPVVVLNKTDVSFRSEDEMIALAEGLSKRLGGVGVVRTSAHTGTGMGHLSEHLTRGETVAFIGPSGVGKSSLVNTLLDEPRQEALEVRSRDMKGRHTTTRRELFILDGGAFLIDTPGFRQFAVVNEGSPGGFEDVDALATLCRFADCSHQSEPGCAVRAAVEDGQLDPDRLQSQQAIEQEARRLEAKQGGPARQQQHNEDRRFGRMVRAATGRKKNRDRY